MKNPCFDPALITIDPVPLPPGPHSYKLYSYDFLEPYWIITHDSWSYSTQPTSHQFCGTISYSATYEGVVADEFSMPNMVYHQSNQTFGIYSTDFGLIGMTTLTLSGYLTDYPMITTVDGVAP